MEFRKAICTWVALVEGWLFQNVGVCCGGLELASLLVSERAKAMGTETSCVWDSSFRWNTLANSFCLEVWSVSFFLVGNINQMLLNSHAIPARISSTLYLVLSVLLATKFFVSDWPSFAGQISVSLCSLFLRLKLCKMNLVFYVGVGSITLIF